jgi:hypothetical protein
MRRLRHFALVVGLVAASFAFTPLASGANGAAQSSRSSDQLTSLLTRPEATLARITTDDRREPTRGVKLPTSLLLAVIAASLAVTARWVRNAHGARAQVEHEPASARHLGRSPPTPLRLVVH